MKTGGRGETSRSVPVRPQVRVRNLQRKIRLDSAALNRFGQRAGVMAAELAPRRSRATDYPDEIFVMLISDERIAALHRRFMNVAGPTDVITFQHGEIFISAATAQRQAREFGTSTMREIQLYIAHGLLHLRGFDDRNALQRAEMRAAEAKLLRRLNV